MRKRYFCLAITLAAYLPVTTSMGAELAEEFNIGAVDPNHWCPCQINLTKTPVTFTSDPDNPSNLVAHITVDENSLGGNKCKQDDPDFECGRPPEGIVLMDEGAAGEVEPLDLLGPSFMAVTEPQWEPTPDRPDPYCNEEILEKVKNGNEEKQCIQRQELRLAKQFTHDAAKTHLYSLRFRMPKEIGDQTNSIRWVTAQWKHEPVSEAYKKEFGDEWGASPFLAQRFDDGVLHITVQDEHCRCMIASAPNVDGSTFDWNNGTPEYCQSTRPEDSKGKRCTPNLQVEYGTKPVLSSPAGNWVEMNYRVQAGRSGSAMIEISEGTRFIVRVTGKIGYEPPVGRTSKTKFKIGQYRDYMPFVDTIDVDWVRIAPQ
ncbi:hypothetical protein GOL30_30085 [Sinorhizobium medicae]|uniref:heparin lyase I family protein n=1 Tax=Sinorhizobium medicae TaxID=110321 RepID=UPI00299D3FA7|nr:heparin lyase I family protein [Sinorhizobium medicae]MDX0432832.1 hypothetical protein [Sinorhizobium medicae]MDX0531536.1 hypothetical protein [Sinorhizobium medicae]MDX0931486.1 hypothetical protein [Sinorhizobium medicae]MDX0993002.1 hypothetical protein [Sinorhizobium medicae]MDX1078854.1 hypothetical protein [Sinorhizobium medicae]